MELETLKAKLMATSQMGNVLDSTARSAEGVADELQNSAAAGELLATGMDSAQDETNVLARALAQARNQATEAGIATEAFAEGLDESSSASTRAAAAAKLIEQQIGEVGDEALKSAAETGVLDASLSDLDGNRVGADFSALLAGTAGSDAALGRLKQSLTEANQESVEGAAAANIYAEGLDESAQSSAEAAAASAMAEQQIENVGEEALKSAAKTEAFDQSLDDIDGAGVRANLLGISGGLGTVAKVAGAATPAILGVTAALGGLGAVGAGAAVGGIGLTAAGIQSRAEEMAAFSEELETAADAREQLMGNFKSELESATDVLQNAQSEEFAMANMAGAVDIVENGANALAAVQPTIFGLAEGFRETAVAVSPELFGALGSEVEDLAPLLSELDGVVRDLPALITFLGDAAERVGPDLFAFAAAAVEVIGPVTSVGLAISDVALPPLNAMLFVLGGVLGLWELLPAPLQNAAAAFGVAAGAAYLLSSAMAAYSGTTFAATLATQGLIAALGTLTAPISAPAAAIALLIGALAGLATHFGAVDYIVSNTVAQWNALVSAFEWTINTAWQLYDALGILGPILFPGIAAVEGLIFVLKLLGDFLGWLGGVAGDFFGWLAEKIEMLEEKLDGFIEFLDGVTNAAGLDTKVKAEQEKTVDLSAAKIGGNSDDEDGDGSDGGDDPPPPAAPAATTEPSRRQRRRSRSDSSGSPTYDFSGADFSGSDPTRTKEQIKQAVEEANRESRNAEEGRVE